MTVFVVLLWKRTCCCVGVGFVETKIEMKMHRWHRALQGNRHTRTRALVSMQRGGSVHRPPLRTCFAQLMCLPSKIYADHRIASHKRQRIYVSSLFFVLFLGYMSYIFCLSISAFFLFLASFIHSLISVCIVVVDSSAGFPDFLLLCFALLVLILSLCYLREKRKRRSASHTIYSPPFGSSRMKNTKRKPLEQLPISTKRKVLAFTYWNCVEYRKWRFLLLEIIFTLLIAVLFIIS